MEKCLALFESNGSLPKDVGTLNIQGP